MTMLFEWLISNAVTASLLALVALVVSMACPRRPALAHACWLLVLVKLLTPPFYVFPLSMPAATFVSEVKPVSFPPTDSVVVASQTAKPVESTDQEKWQQLELESRAFDHLNENLFQESATEPASACIPALTLAAPVSRTANWLQLFSDCWQTWGESLVVTAQFLALGGSILLLLMTIWRAYRFDQLLRFAKPVDEELQQTTRYLGTALGIQHIPAVVTIPGKVGPLLWQRWNGPVIVLPAGLLDNMNGQELQTVLAHELTHYRRGDHLWRYLELAAVTFYWWLPTAWWASRRLRQAEEECCDAGVVASLPDGVASYATALVRSLTYVAEPSSPCPALSSGLGPVTLLKRRLIMLQAKVERQLGIRSWFLLSAVAALALPIGISLADDDTPPPPRRPAEKSRDERPRNRPALPPVEAGDDLPGTPVPSRPPVAPLAPRSGPLPPIDAPTAGIAPGQGSPLATPAIPGRPAQPSAPSGIYYYGDARQGSSDEEVQRAEEAVRQAEIDLKIRRMKVKQADTAANVYSKNLARMDTLVKTGAVSNAEVQLERERLEQAKIDIELAKLGVEQGELTLEQAKRRLSHMTRRGQATPMIPPASTQPVPVPPGAMGGLPPAIAPRGVGPVGGDHIPGPGGIGSVSTTGSSGLGGGRGVRTSDDQLKTMFEIMDREKNGRVTRDHFPGFWRDRFDEIDKNHDGFVTFDEFKSAREILSVRGGGMGGGFGMSGSGFVRGPGAGAGFGSGGMAGGPAADPFFRNFDRQNTGKIRREDVPEWMRDRFFEIVDTNRDGVVDQQEFSANYSKLWESPSSRRAAAGATRSSGRSEATDRTEAGGRGDAGIARRERPESARDPRDERIQQLENDLREMRKMLDSLKTKDRAPIKP